MTDPAKPVGKLSSLIRFTLLGVPSVLVLTVSLVFVALSLSAAAVKYPYPIFAVLGTVVGALGVLGGTGKWGQWLHLIPFFAAPFLFFALLFLSGLLGLGEPELVAAVLTMVALVWVSRRTRRSYEKRGVGHVRQGV